MIIFNGGFIGGALPDASLVFSDHNDGTSSPHSYAVTLGPESVDRLIVVATAIGNGVPSSVTLNGTPLTTIPALSSIIYYASVPTGTTGTIAVSRTSGDLNGSVLYVWAITGLMSTSPVDAESTGGPTPVSLSLSCEDQGVRIAMGYQVNVGVDVSLSGVTQDALENNGLASEVTSRGGHSINTATGSVTITADGPTSAILAAISFR